jgi:propanediol dehydratase small subunit
VNAETRALSGRTVDDLTLGAVRVGEAGLADLRIHPETLERQAVIAKQHANPQLAANLRRAAELTRLPDQEVLAIYEALRPGRSTVTELTALAGSLAARGLPLNAALVAEAAEIYARRGLTRADGER